MSVYFKGIKATVKAINQYIADAEKNALLACENIALEGQQEADDRYADYEGPDGNSVIVDDPTPIKKGSVTVGYSVEATGVTVYADGKPVGNSITFEEFGSGLLAGSHPMSTEFPYVYPGSWSETYGSGEYARTGKWHFGKDQFVYIAPTYAMYLAGKTMEKVAIKEMKEAFK